MECKDYFELMNMYIDEEISEADKNKLIKHIESCESCKQEFEELKEMVNILREEPLSELPLGYHKELMEKINNEVNNKVVTLKPKKSKNNIYRYFGLVAVFALFVVGGNKAGLFDIKNGKFENMPSNVVSENTNDVNNNVTNEDIIDKSSEVVENSVENTNADDNEVISKANDSTTKNEIITRNNTNIINENTDTTNTNDNINNSTSDNITNENNSVENNVTTDNIITQESDMPKTAQSQTPQITSYNMESNDNGSNEKILGQNSVAKSADFSGIESVITNIELNNKNSTEDYNFIINTANEYKCTVIEETDLTKIEVPKDSYNSFVETLKSKDVYIIEETKENLTNSYAELNEKLSDIEEKIDGNENSNELLNEASEISEKIKNIEHYKYFSDIYVYK